MTEYFGMTSRRAIADLLSMERRNVSQGVQYDSLTRCMQLLADRSLGKEQIVGWLQEGSKVAQETAEMRAPNGFFSSVHEALLSKAIYDAVLLYIAPFEEVNHDTKSV